MKKISIKFNYMLYGSTTRWYGRSIPTGNGMKQIQTRHCYVVDSINGLVQDCSISIANALKILHSCTKPSLCLLHNWMHIWTKYRTWVCFRWHFQVYFLERNFFLLLNISLKFILAVLVKPWSRFDVEEAPTWWRHQIETFSALLAICAGNSPITGEFPTQRPVTRSFDGFFDLHLNKRLSKQSRGWWSEMPSRPLRRHCN